MSNQENHIEKLTPELMQQYLDDQLSEEQCHAIEKYLLNNDFEAEAMEGFETLNTTELKSDLSTLQNKLNNRTQSTKQKFPLLLKIAASIIFLAVCSYISIQLFKAPINNEETLALSPVDDENSIEDKLALPDSQPQTEEVVDEVIESEEETPIQNQASTSQINEATNSDRTANEEIIAPAQEPSTIAAMEYEAEETETLEEITEDNIELDMLQETKASRVAEGTDKERLGIASKSAKKATAPTMIEQAKRKASNKLTGQVKSAEDGSPIAGVNVIAKNTAEGVVTDIDGNYEITIPSGADSTLVFSFIGLASKEVYANGKEQLDVFLDNDAQELSEVVITRSTGEKADYEQTYTAARPTMSKSDYKTYLEENIKYPQDSDNINGKVVVRFIVNTNGALSDFEISKSLGTAFDQEAIRLIKEGPSWKVATKNGDRVEDTVKVTVRFKK